MWSNLATCHKMDAFNSETAAFRETGFFFLDGKLVLHNLCFVQFNFKSGICMSEITGNNDFLPIISWLLFMFPKSNSFSVFKMLLCMLCLKINLIRGQPFSKELISLEKQETNWDWPQPQSQLMHRFWSSCFLSS